MRNGTSLRGFTVGVLVGVLAGSAGMASATFGLKAWTRLSDDYRTGYINGFLDMATLARNLQPGGWVDERYPAFPQARPLEWKGTIDKLYEDPANKDFLITSMIQLAGKKMEERYGKPTDPAQRAKARMDAQLAALKNKFAKSAENTAEKNKEEAADAAAKAPAKPAEKPAAAATPAVPLPEGKAVQVPVPPRSNRKWCRCDGTDYKAAREKRRAEAAAAEAAEEEAAKAAAAKAAAAPPSASAGGTFVPVAPRKPAAPAAPAAPASGATAEPKAK